MTIINGVNMPNFTHDEIPSSIAQFIDRRILANVQEYRNILGKPFYISKAEGALVRFDGSVTSEHYVMIPLESIFNPKLSRAIDGFPDGDIFEAWVKAISCQLFGGIGVYFDTRNNQGIFQPMLHLDLRVSPLIWYRNNGEYFYPGRDGKVFFKNLYELLKG